jgi:hypothetical protein
MQEWSYSARGNVLRLRKTTPLVTFLVGWLVGRSVGWLRGLLITLIMEAVRTTETLVNFYHTTGRYNPEDSHRNKGYVLEALRTWLPLNAFSICTSKGYSGLLNV